MALIWRSIRRDSSSRPRFQRWIRYAPQFLRARAAELGPHKIRVNAVNSGRVVTEGLTGTDMHKRDGRRRIEAVSPMGRIDQPEDIAPAMAFFAADASSWVTGETLYLTGGDR